MLRSHQIHLGLRPKGSAAAGPEEGAPLSEDEPETRIARRRGIGYAVPHFSRACLLRLIDYPEMPFRIATCDVVKAGRTALIVRTELPVAGRMVSVAYKRIRRHNWVKRWTGAFRLSRAMKSWRMGRMFRQRGIRTARPLAVILSRQRLGRDAYLITEWIDGARSLDACCRQLDQLDTAERRARARAAAVCLGDTIGRMHAEGFSHRDLKSGNLLMVESGKSVAAYVVDLDGARSQKQVPRRVRLRNLARLVIAVDGIRAASLSTRLCFLMTYLRAIGEEPEAWKSYWKQLDAVSAARRLRKQRNAA